MLWKLTKTLNKVENPVTTGMEMEIIIMEIIIAEEVVRIT